MAEANSRSATWYHTEPTTDRIIVTKTGRIRVLYDVPKLKMIAKGRPVKERLDAFVPPWCLDHGGWLAGRSQQRANEIVAANPDWRYGDIEKFFVNIPHQLIVKTLRRLNVPLCADTAVPVCAEWASTAVPPWLCAAWSAWAAAWVTVWSDGWVTECALTPTAWDLATAYDPETDDTDAVQLRDRAVPVPNTPWSSELIAWVSSMMNGSSWLWLEWAATAAPACAETSAPVWALWASAA